MSFGCFAANRHEIKIFSDNWWGAGWMAFSKKLNKWSWVEHEIFIYCVLSVSFAFSTLLFWMCETETLLACCYVDYSFYRTLFGNEYGFAFKITWRSWQLRNTGQTSINSTWVDRFIVKYGSRLFFKGRLATLLSMLQNKNKHISGLFFVLSASLCVRGQMLRQHGFELLRFHIPWGLFVCRPGRRLTAGLTAGGLNRLDYDINPQGRAVGQTWVL